MKMAKVPTMFRLSMNTKRRIDECVDMAKEVQMLEPTFAWFGIDRTWVVCEGIDKLHASMAAKLAELRSATTTRPAKTKNPRSHGTRGHKATAHR